MPLPQLSVVGFHSFACLDWDTGVIWNRRGEWVIHSPCRGVFSTPMRQKLHWCVLAVYVPRGTKYGGWYPNLSRNTTHVVFVGGPVRESDKGQFRTHIVSLRNEKFYLIDEGSLVGFDTGLLRHHHCERFVRCNLIYILECTVNSIEDSFLHLNPSTFLIAFTLSARKMGRGRVSRCLQITDRPAASGCFSDMGMLDDTYVTSPLTKYDPRF